MKLLLVDDDKIIINSMPAVFPWEGLGDYRNLDSFIHKAGKENS